MPGASNGKHYDPDFLCQDDYEWLTETGQYANERVAIIRRGLQKQRDALMKGRRHTSQSLLTALWFAPHSVSVTALQAVMEALDAQLANIHTRLLLLNAYPHVGYYHLAKSEV